MFRAEGGYADQGLRSAMATRKGGLFRGAEESANRTQIAHPQPFHSSFKKCRQWRQVEMEALIPSELIVILPSLRVVRTRRSCPPIQTPLA